MDDMKSPLLTAIERRRDHLKCLVDLSLWTLATPLAFIVRLDLLFVDYVNEIMILTAIGLPVKSSIIYLLGFHRQSWQNISFRDPLRLLLGIMCGTAILAAAAFMLHTFLEIPRSIPLIDGMLGLGLLCAPRGISRLVHDWRLSRTNGKEIRRVLIVGAGQCGTMMVRALTRHSGGQLRPVGFLDDDTAKHRQTLLGLPVLGSIKQLPEAASRCAADEIITAIPSAPPQVLRDIVKLSQQAGLRHRIIPSIYDILSGKLPTHTRDVDMTDLLGRDAVSLPLDETAACIKGRVVLVSGAGGSIGSEIVRQLTGFKPKQVILFGRGENSLFELEQNLREFAPQTHTIAVIGDIRDRQRLEHVFATYQPRVIFHAAAHKHVPMMEANPDEAVFNNVGGTRNLVELALEHNVERFVNISTDKAVNPTSVMGATKRVAEQVVAWAASQAPPDRCFVSVRFGNVLGSRGSVVPTFQRQILAGGPITITHPKMTRYFKTIPEAAQLVLRAGGFGENGQVYVLDMGKPVRVIDLARDLIRLSGLEPDVDIKIQHTGVRPGEKMCEELLTAEDGTVASRHEKIFVARCSTPPADGIFTRDLENLFNAAELRNPTAIRQMLQTLVPTYSPHNGWSKDDSPAKSEQPRQATPTLTELRRSG